MSRVEFYELDDRSRRIEDVVSRVQKRARLGGCAHLQNMIPVRSVPRVIAPDAGFRCSSVRAFRDWIHKSVAVAVALQENMLGQKPYRIVAEF